MIQLSVWPEASVHRPALMAAVREERSKKPRWALAVGTGWSGPKDFFDRKDAMPLCGFIRSQLPQGAWHIDAWANVMGSEDRIGLHDHVKSHRGGENTWSGVYYLAVPPRTSPLIVHLKNGTHPLYPREGDLVVFESDTMHEVPGPWLFEGERISIAFNATRAG